jgi:hypothetical protein
MKTKRLQSAVRQWRRRFNGRLFFGVFIVLMIVTAIYVSRQPRLYEARGMLELPRPVIQVLNTEVEDASIQSGYDVNTVLAVMASQTMTHWVMDRLTSEERRAFFEPYGLSDQSDEVLQRLIRANRTLAAEPRSYAIWMRYRHPDRHIASRIVELVLDQSVDYDARVRGDERRGAMENLKLRAEQAGLQAEERAQEVVNYKKRWPNLSAAELERDETYQALVKKAEIGKNLHAMILKRLDDVRDTEGHEAGGWRIGQPPGTPDEGDYLIAPLAVTFGWGTLIATVTAGLAAVLFQRRSVPVNQPEGL